jgi:hypothetical protein
MHGTPLVAGIWKYLRYGFKHPKIFVANDKTNTGKFSFFKSYKEQAPAFFILFHAFGYTDNFTTSIIADTDGYKNRDVLDLTTSTTF